MTAKYVYCIAGSRGIPQGQLGLQGEPVTAVTQQDIAAIVSPVPFKEIDANVENIFSHQRIVEASRQAGTTLPVKFGTIFRSDEAVRRWLQRSYGEYKKKLTRFEKKDEFGVKVIMDERAKKKIYQSVHGASREETRSGEGTTYLLRIKQEEAVKREALKRIDRLAGEIHQELSTAPRDGVVLATELEQVILNGAYLVGREQAGAFNSKLTELKNRYKEYGLSFHISGPWAPYSFC